jgi:four helix bundle protein
MEEGRYLELGNLDAYVWARKYGNNAYDVYRRFDWHEKKLFGDQFIRSIDSVGANIAEGYGRYHYLDKNKFYYNARGSLLESRHWSEIIFERNLIDNKEFDLLMICCDNIHRLLNGLIKSQFLKKIDN